MIELRVNGVGVRLDADPRRSLLDVLREELDLTGAKPACGEGQCGACTVLVDGRPTRSCITAVGEVGAGTVTTIEGLAAPGKLHPVQTAILRHQALGCGYCTPGVVMAAVGLLTEDPAPDNAAIVTAMNGNLCRCGAYPRIVAAVGDAARALRDGR